MKHELKWAELAFDLFSLTAYYSIVGIGSVLLVALVFYCIYLSVTYLLP